MLVVIKASAPVGLAMMAALLSGCISVDAPSDLTFLSVEEVDWHSQRERNELIGNGAADTQLNVAAPSQGERAGRALVSPLPALKIFFSSRVNLHNFALTGGYNLGISATFCKDKKDATNLALSNVYSNGHLVVSDPANLQTTIMRGEEKVFVYYAYLNVKNDTPRMTIPPRQTYDLQRSPEDICVQLEGGSEIGLGYRSNAFRLPRAEIARSLTAHF
jgi:hypothetical protein